MSVFPLQVEIYLIIIIIIFLKQSSLKVMKPTDPGKCAQPVLLSGEGRRRKLSLPEKCLVLCAYSSVVGPTAVLF